ncbi:MAG: TetR family transcriptional regulator, partial [Pseudomonadota bacterium]
MNSATKSPDKRRARGEESRKAILQAAISSIAALGLSNLTLDRVAERAGISRALVVFHFKSKNKLTEEVLAYLGVQYAK